MIDPARHADTVARLDPAPIGTGSCSISFRHAELTLTLAVVLGDGCGRLGFVEVDGAVTTLRTCRDLEI